MSFLIPKKKLTIKKIDVKDVNIEDWILSEEIEQFKLDNDLRNSLSEKGYETLFDVAVYRYAVVNGILSSSAKENNNIRQIKSNIDISQEISNIYESIIFLIGKTQNIGGDAKVEYEDNKINKVVFLFPSFWNFNDTEEFIIDFSNSDKNIIENKRNAEDYIVCLVNYYEKEEKKAKLKKDLSRQIEKTKKEYLDSLSEEDRKVIED